MDVKAAKALSERLAEAARNVEPPPRKRWTRETPTERQSRRHYGEGVTKVSRESRYSTGAVRLTACLASSWWSRL